MDLSDTTWPPMVMERVLLSSYWRDQIDPTPSKLCLTQCFLILNHKRCLSSESFRSLSNVKFKNKNHIIISNTLLDSPSTSFVFEDY